MNGIIKEEFSWGDGQSTTITDGSLPSHLYCEQGTYTVTRTVYLEDGTITSHTYELDIEVYPTGEGYGCSEVKHKCYRFGRNATEGHGASELGGEFFPNQIPSINPLIIKDSNNIRRTILIDEYDRTFYELVTSIGPSGSGIDAIWRDKCDIAGDNGEPYECRIELRAIKGELEAYWIENISTNLYTEPVNEAFRNCNTYRYDEHGYPDELEVSISIKTEDNKKIPDVITRKIKLPKHEVTFDRKVEGHYLAPTVSWNVAPLIVKGLTYNVLRKNRLDNATAQVQSEQTSQDILADNKWWISRVEPLIRNRVTGEKLIFNDWEPDQGPDGKDSYGAIKIIDGQIDIPFDSFMLIWYKADETNFPYSLDELGRVGNWICGTTIAHQGDVLPIGSYFDIRLFDLNIFNQDNRYILEYYFEDVKYNHGDVLLPATI